MFKFENQLIEITATDQLNGTLKALIKSKHELTAGIYGLYKGLEIVYSTEPEYSDNKLVLCNEVGTECTIKENDLLKVLTAFKYFQEIIPFKKAAFSIDGTDYIKHNNKAAYLQIDKHEELNELVSGSMPQKQYNYKQEPNKQLAEQPAIYEILQLKPYCLDEPIKESKEAGYLTEPTEQIKNIDPEILKQDNLLNKGIVHVNNKIGVAAGLLLKRIIDTDLLNRKKYNEIGAALLNCESLDQMMSTLYYEPYRKESESVKELNDNEPAETFDPENWNIVLRSEPEIYEQLKTEMPEFLKQFANHSDYEPIKEPAPVNYSNRNYKPVEFKDVYPNNGKKFTYEDDEKLEYLYKAGKSIKDLSEIFGRTEQSIKNRLKALELLSDPVKDIKESVPAEVPEIVNTIKEPEPIKESPEVQSDDYILKTKIKQYNHIKDIIIKINKYTDKYLSLTGGCYYIKELIKQHKGKFYYNLPGLKNAWIIPRSEVRSLIAEIKN